MGIYITGVGSYIPSHKERNQDFLSHKFLDDSGNPFGTENTDIIEKFNYLIDIENFGDSL